MMLRVVVAPSLNEGSSLTALMVIDTVAAALSRAPSFTL